MRLIPNPTLVWCIQTVSLDGTEYRIEYKWSTREQRWYLHLKDRDENLLVGSVKLVPWVGLLRNHTEANLPPGDLILIDNENDFGVGGDVPTKDNFGTRFELYYVDASELQ